MNCKYCGTTLDQDSSFCKGCGTRADHATALPLPASTPKPKKSKTTRIVAISVAATLVLAVGLFVAELFLDVTGLFGPVVIHHYPEYNNQPQGDWQDWPDDQSQPTEPIEYSHPSLPATPSSFFTTANLHLRAGPSTDTESLELVPRGTRVTVVFYYSAEWFRVQHWSDASPNSITGYMARQFLTENLASLIDDPTRVNLALLWQVWGRDDLTRILGAPVHEEFDGNPHFGEYIREYRYGITQHHGFRVEFDETNRTRFHWNGLDGTSTRDDVIAALGQPDWMHEEYYNYTIEETWVGLNIQFDADGIISVIQISVSPT